MKKIQILLMAIMLVISANAFTEIVESYTWKAFPGKGQQMLNNMQEAAKIQTALGASVSINALNVGGANEVDYVIRVDDIQSWGELKDKLTTSPEWLRFFSKIGRNPTGELQSSLTGINLDPSKKASDFNDNYVYGVWVWDPAVGRNAEVVQTLLAGSQIDKSLGARVEVYSEGVGGTGNYYYVLFFDSWTSMSDYFSNSGASKERADFVSSIDPASMTLVRSFTGSTVPSTN